MELRAIINFCPSEADLKRFSSSLKTALMGIESSKSTIASLASKRFLEVMCQLEVFSSAASVIFLVFLAINPIPKLQPQLMIVAKFILFGIISRRCSSILWVSFLVNSVCKLTVCSNLKIGTYRSEGYKSTVEAMVAFFWV